MIRIVKMMLIIFCISLLVMSIGCNSPSGITEDDEPVILFQILEYDPDMEGYAVVYVDNKGNIYYDYLYDQFIPLLESGTYEFGEIVGHLPSKEVIDNYNKYYAIPEEICCEHVDTSGAAPGASIQLYYVLKYTDEGIEAERIWDYRESIMLINDESGKEIVLWMDSWEWELDKKGWDDETQQWYPDPDYSRLEYVWWMFEE